MHCPRIKWTGQRSCLLGFFKVGKTRPSSIGSHRVDGTVFQQLGLKLWRVTSMNSISVCSRSFADIMSPSHLLSVDTRESADSVAKMAVQYAEEAHLCDNDII